MLLVDYGNAEIAEHHRVFYHGMRADKYLHVAVGKAVQYLSSLLAFHDARQQLHADVHALHEFLYGGKMLLGKYLSRRHHDGLKTIIDGNEHRHQRHQSLAGTDVALYQAVHLTTGIHVLLYLVHHTLLGTGELERQVVMVELVKRLSHLRHQVALVLLPVVRHIARYVQLHVEELLELQPLAGMLHLVLVVGIVDAADGFVAADEVSLLYDEVGQRLTQRRQLLQHALHDALDAARGHAGLLHLLRSVIVGLQTHIVERHAVDVIDVGMAYLKAVVENAGTSEDDVLTVYLIRFNNILHPREPHQVNDAGAVREMGHETLLLYTHVEGLVGQYPPSYLHKGHVGCQFVDRIDLGTVHILVGVVLYQIADTHDAQLLVEHLLAAGTYACNVFYVLIKNRWHQQSLNRTGWLSLCFHGYPLPW